MKDLAAIVKNVASDMVEAGEKAGKAFMEHLKGVGQGIKDSAETYRRTEDDIKNDIGKIGHDGESDLSRGADSAGRDAGGGAGPVHGEPAGGEHGGSGEGGSTPEEQKVSGGRTSGSDGATDDPVDVVTGEMFLPQEDLALPGVLPLVLSRRHGSAYRDGRSFGTSWASALDQRVVTGANEIRFLTEDGRALYYPVPEDGERVMPSHGPRWPLTWDRDADTVVVEQGDLGLALSFPAAARPGPERPLEVITDRAGSTITFERAADGILTAVRHSGGYHVKVASQVTLGGRRVTGLALADPAGGGDITVREFRYDFSGNLTGVVNESGLPLLFEYDDRQRITRWEDRNGYEYRYTYREDGRVIRGEGSEGFLNVTLDYDLDERSTTVTDALGHATVHHWNDRLQVTRVTDPLGHETRTEKDEYGNVVAITDGLGHITRIDRDEYGDPVLVSKPDGSAEAFTFNDSRQPISVAGGDGRPWAYEYDDRGALASAEDPAGATTRYQRDDQGRLTAIIDPLGLVTQVRCDETGLPAEVTDPLGARYSYRRDAFGRVTEVTDPLGLATRITWTVSGKPLTLTRADGTSETWEHDAEGNLVAHSDGAGRVTRFERGPFDLPTERVDPDGAVYRFAYTPQFQVESVSGALGRIWRYEHDAAGRVVAETDFSGVRQEYQLDAAGQVVGRVNGAGQRATFVWDSQGRLAARAEEGVTCRYEYGPDGSLTRAEAPGSVVEYSRDPAGRIVSESINGRAVTSRYDLAGRLVSRTTPSGVTSDWEYDDAGRATRLRTGNDVLEFSHDSAGNEIRRSLGPLAELTQSFDVVGRLVNQNIWTTGQRDEPGRPDRRLSAQSRTYDYGLHGLPLEVGDQLRGTSQFGLDAAGRVARVQAEGWREEYAYDTLGNITSAQFPGDSEGISGDRVVEGTLLRRAGRTRYEYDEAGRLVRKIRRTLSGQTRTWAYTWNADDQLTAVVTPGRGTWRYLYDPLGRRIAKQQIGDDAAVLEETRFAWEGPRVVEQDLSAPDGYTAVTTWDYQNDSFSPLAQTQREWDGSVPPEEPSEAAAQPEIDRKFYAIVADLVGTPQELVSADGEVVWRPAAGLWGQTMASGTAAADCPLRFAGQYRDDETGLHYNLNRYYDPETARYLTSDPIGIIPGPNPNIYVGNPTAEIDPRGLGPCDVLRGTSNEDLRNLALSPYKKVAYNKEGEIVRGQTNAGRALQKHADASRGAQAAHFPSFKSDVERNKAGQEMIDKLLDNPASDTTRAATPHYGGSVRDIRHADGWGARWSMRGGNPIFEGFLAP